MGNQHSTQHRGGPKAGSSKGGESQQEEAKRTLFGSLATKLARMGASQRVDDVAPQRDPSYRALEDDTKPHAPKRARIPDSVDILDVVKVIVQFGLSQVPYAGKLISVLIGVLWASGPSIWEQIREEVERLSDQKIPEGIFSLLTAQLAGLGDALRLYIRAVEAGKEDLIRTQFVAANTVFIATCPSFQNPDHQWVLSPLFAIFTQLHMTLLRDCIVNGKSWGWTPQEYATIAEQASQTTKDYIAYLDSAVASEEARLQKNAPTSAGQHRTAIWDYWQPFNMRNIMLIDDFRLLLQYLDPVAHPGPTLPSQIPFRDVYSHAFGTADDWDGTASGWGNAVTTPWSRPLAGFSSIDIELFNRTPRVVNANYPSRQGPALWGSETDRRDQVGIIANSRGGVEKYSVDIPSPSSNKAFNVVGVNVNKHSIPLSVQLVLDDGDVKTLWDRWDLGYDWEYVSVSGRMLTTFSMWTRSRFYDSDLGCIIFGFSRDPKYVPSMVFDALYVGAIGDPMADIPDIHTVSPKIAERRRAFWEDIRAAEI